MRSAIYGPDISVLRNWRVFAAAICHIWDLQDKTARQKSLVSFIFPD